MERQYEHDQVEQKWQRIWEEQQTFRATEDTSRPKYYCLEMFPYPSGRIHMGHVRVYAIGDVVARFKTMRGHAVLHPMGWDAFGLPAENAAIEKGVPPDVWTRDNIVYMRDQLERLQSCDRLTAWPARVLAMQRNWIGKSIGVEVDFPLADPFADLPAIRIFTTRQDTIFGATFMSLAPESPLVERLITGRPQATAVREFVARVSREDKVVRIAVDREKEGIFTGAYAVNPFTKAGV